MCSIHNGVDTQEFRADGVERAAARAEFGYKDDDLVCGIAARLVPAKGHEYLFRAAALLKKEFPGLRVLVLGRGDLETELVKLAGELGIGEIVRFAGFREDMARCTQAFDIGVQPSVDCDTSSFSLKEQMAEEKPVVCSDYGGLTEILTDGVEGFIVPTRTVEPLAEAMKKLLIDSELRPKMGAAGRQRVLKEFTLEMFAERTVEAYYRALEIHGARSAS
jgi:glycosyltransferase involved in cell wall biosynthesis